MNFRQIVETDVRELIAVRAATRENALSREQLEEMGITEASVSEMMQRTHRGWLCEAEGRIVGFAMGNGETGEMWVIAVLPEFWGRGIGGRLIASVENWLWSRGHDEAWLTTDKDTSLRAYGFYLRQGWSDSKLSKGCRYMIKRNPNQACASGSRKVCDRSTVSAAEIADVWHSPGQGIRPAVFKARSGQIFLSPASFFALRTAAANDYTLAP